MKSCGCRAGGFLVCLVELEGSQADLLLFRVLEKVVEVLLEDVVVVLLAEAEGVEKVVG